jgi:hypothetical protein
MNPVHMKKNLLLVLIILIVSIIAALYGPIPQPGSYHDFADKRTILGVNNALNVLSNLLFMITGAWGCAAVLGLIRAGSGRKLLLQYLLFFAGIFLTGIGSSFYHYNPSNSSLVWDRLPMALAFTAFLASVISESIDRHLGNLLLVPLIAAGIFSVLYWAFTENAGHGDLRAYILVQLLTMVLVPLILLLYKPGKDYSVPLWWLVILYGLSKVPEFLDRQIYSMTGFVSGHTLKHILAAIGIVFVIKMLYARKKEFEKIG